MTGSHITSWLESETNSVNEKLQKLLLPFFCRRIGGWGTKLGLHDLFDSFTKKRAGG